MKTVSFSCGFQAQLADDVMNNMELVNVLAEGDDTNPLTLSRLLRLLLGEQEKKNLYAALRTEDGRVPVEKVVGAVKEIFDAFGETGKNS